jgi:hypothetical protein
LGRFKLFLYCTNFVAKRVEVVQLVHKFVPHSRVRNFLQRMPLIHPIELQTHVLVRFELFCYCPNCGAKQAELVQLTHKFIERNRVGIICNERIKSTPLDPKLMF